MGATGGSALGTEGMTTELLEQSINSSDEGDVYIKTTAKDFFLLDFFEEQV